MEKISYRPIGVIHSPFKEPEGTPIQAAAAQAVHGTIEVFQEYAEGLEDLGGFSHIILIYHFHLSKGSSLKVRPFLDDQAHGVFSTRAPGRPNPIGISVAELIHIKGNILQIKGMDIIDGTPLLDIKPYVSDFDARASDKKGWLERNLHKLSKAIDDGRFITGFYLT